MPSFFRHSRRTTRLRLFSGMCGQSPVTLFSSCVPTDVLLSNVEQFGSGPNCAVIFTGRNANPCCGRQTLTLPETPSATTFTPSILFRDVTQIVAQCTSSGTTTTCSFNYTLDVVACKPCPTSTRQPSVGRTSLGSGLVHQGSVTSDVVMFPLQIGTFEGTCGQSAVALFTSCKPVDVLFSAMQQNPPTCDVTFSGTSCNPAVGCRQ